MERKGQGRFIGIIIVLILLVLVIWGFFYVYPFFNTDLNIQNQNRLNFITFNTPNVNSLVLEEKLIVSEPCAVNTFISYENLVEEEEIRDVISGYYYEVCNDCSSPKVFVTYNTEKEDTPKGEVINNIYQAPECKCREPLIVGHITDNSPAKSVPMNSIYVASKCC